MGMAPQDRERADRRLYTLTVWIGAVGAGLVGVFAGIAAATVPGTSDASASTGTPAATGDESQPEDEATPPPFQVQPPISAPVAAPPDVPHARSGGSSHR